MTDERRFYAVDRLEGDCAVLVRDRDLRIVEVPLASLPFVVREGMVLSVPIDERGVLQWGRTARDEAEERRRYRDGRARLERLEGRDPGSDIEAG